jgi:hypothetical protein
MSKEEDTSAPGVIVVGLVGLFYPDVVGNMGAAACAALDAEEVEVVVVAG